MKIRSAWSNKLKYKWNAKITITDINSNENWKYENKHYLKILTNTPIVYE